MNHAVLKMIWTPESVQTGSDNSPIFRANVASSNGFCIWPDEKNPKSPPFLFSYIIIFHNKFKNNKE